MQATKKEDHYLQHIVSDLVFLSLPFSLLIKQEFEVYLRFQVLKSELPDACWQLPLLAEQMCSLNSFLYVCACSSDWESDTTADSTIILQLSMALTSNKSKLAHSCRSTYSTRKPTTVDIRSQVHLLSHHTVSLPAPALQVKYILQYAEKNALLK